MNHVGSQAGQEGRPKSYASELSVDWGKKAESIYELQSNEIHVVLSSIEDVPDICYYLKDEFDARLVSIVCSDERSIRRSFVLRYIFEIMNGEPNDLFVFVTSEVIESSPSITGLKSATFPSICLKIPSASLYEREIKDMFGLMPIGNPDTRPLVLHEQWPAGQFPLRKEFDSKTKIDRTHKTEYKFTTLQGDGICEIPVGPVHAGIIEPGHFRFSVQGENILNLETKLFYTHKGIEKLAENLALDKVLMLSERISGDESVANSMAYCQAIEKAARASIPEKALLTRTMCAEMERIYNHIGTLAGITSDVGFAFGAARLSILKEKMMALNERLTGSRLLFGVNRLGGVGIEVSPSTAADLQNSVNSIIVEFDQVVSFLRSKSSVLDRLRNTGTISRTVANDLALVGLAARSSGIDVDTRRDHPYGAYPLLKADSHHDSAQHLTKYRVDMQKMQGDALSRFEIRIFEVLDSGRIIGQVTERLLDLDGKDIVNPEIQSGLVPYSHALGYAESHRGQTIHWVMIGRDSDSLFRYKVRTASFVNWPAIEQAVLNDIVPDFPLVNKSLDLSYSGNDL